MTIPFGTFRIARLLSPDFGKLTGPMYKIHLFLLENAHVLTLTGHFTD
jgi:hypothetical protein